ncbi:MAG: D-2-hydroxyacid dehydrogenase [Staphylococcus sp.]|nr:D-2-hydroxyacid dehydrogenase [Staphylococcus sp.]
MKKIVILDGYVANSGDLSWGALEDLGSLTVYERTSAADIVERAKGACAIFTNKVIITDEIMEALPDLKFIGVLATGYNNVDLEAARRRGITVCNVPAYSTDSVAQLVFAHLLHIVNTIGDYAASVDRGEWGGNKDFSYRLRPFDELSGMTMGIIGMGNIGRRVAAIAQAFGMRVITTSGRKLPAGVSRVSPDELFAQSDVISLNSALTPATKGIINREAISKMKPTAIIINTSRGPLVDEQALADALNEGRVAAAGIDVLCEEPPRSGSPLIGCRNCFVTPHIAWQSSQARRRLIDISVENLKAFMAGSPQNIV